MKVPENIPGRLCITNGKIKLLDGTDATSYLRRWQKDKSICNGVVINCLPRADLAELVNELWEQRNLMQCA